jgi:hypothetical protein
VALSYSFPDAYLKKAHIQGARIYISAQNLLTITNYKVADPETIRQLHQHAHTADYRMRTKL